MQSMISLVVVVVVVVVVKKWIDYGLLLMMRLMRLMWVVLEILLETPS